MKNKGSSFCLEIISFWGSVSGNINPRGAAGDETLVLGNPNFTKQSSFGKYLVDYLYFVVNVHFKIGQRRELFEAVLMAMVTKFIVYDL